MIRLTAVARSPNGWPARDLIRPITDVAYFFVGSAAQDLSVSAPWAGWPLIARGVYLRAGTGELFRTRYSRLAALWRRLDPQVFIPIGRSYVVNIPRIAAWERGNVTRIGIRVGDKPGEVDFLPASRRALHAIRSLLG